jgi:hypothetical protein
MHQEHLPVDLLLRATAAKPSATAATAAVAAAALGAGAGRLSPVFPYAHPQSAMSRDSFSSITHSSSSLHTDDMYDTSSPVNDADEIILRTYCTHRPTDPIAQPFSRRDDPRDHHASLWHDLDRDGVHTPAIPSFILNSPPMAPMLSPDYPDLTLQSREHAEVTTHSLRKGCVPPHPPPTDATGCDPKYFFAHPKDTAPKPDMISSSASSDLPESSPNGYHTTTPSPTTTSITQTKALWSTDIPDHKCLPSQGPWGIIPSRSILISNLPKTTQLWTLVELLKVRAPFPLPAQLTCRVWEIARGSSPNESHLMVPPSFPSTISATHCVVSVTSGMIISSRVGDWTRISFRMRR